MSRPFDKNLTDPEDDSLNNNLSARPKSTDQNVDVSAEAVNEDEADFGEMNLEDAIASGYVDEDGQAVSKAVPDVVGSPTGAYTDIGAGRSSAVHHKESQHKESHH